MPIAKPSEVTGGTVFKPAEHMNDLALLIEPKHIERDVPNHYQGETTHRDEVTADITVFGTSEAVETATPTEVLKDVKVVHGMLTSTLERVLGAALVGIVRKIPTKRGAGFAFRDADEAVEAAVTAFYERREAAVQAALSSDAMPGFE